MDVFTLISRSWYHDHDTIANAYGSNEAQAFLAVEKAGQPTLDCVLQWLQALHALRRLQGAVTKKQKETVRELREELESSCSDQPILRWVDSWLPAWVRLCWRAGLVEGVDQRHDLEAATKLLIAVKDDLGRFDFEKFQGGLWDIQEQILYLPSRAFGLVREEGTSIPSSEDQPAIWVVSINSEFFEVNGIDDTSVRPTKSVFR